MWQLYTKTITHEFIYLSHLSGKDFRHHSAASPFVIRNVSPANSPLGKSAFSSANMCEKTKESFVKFRRKLECSSNILSLPSLNSLMLFLHFVIKLSRKTRKNSLSLRRWSRSSYFELTSFRCWYVSGRMSRMKGGEFFRFIFGCWHIFTTCHNSENVDIWGEFKVMVGKNIYVIEVWKIYLSL